MAAYQREIPVRFGHCDPATFVFYPRYFEMINSFVEDWFEDGLEASFPGLLYHKGLLAPTVHFTIDFPRPSRFGDRLTFKLTSNGAPINQYRVWVDSDNNPTTGYAYWGLGADYFLENGYFHRFTGASQSAWSWTLVGSVLEGVSNPAHGVGTTQITATINPDQFNYVQGALVGFLMQHYQSTAPFDLDLLPRSGLPHMMVDNTETQVGIGTNLISGDATFASTTVAFTVRSNGANISAYRLFIDRDNSSATGYRHTAQGITATGADYKVENGNLYSFSGATQTTSNWTLIGAVTQSGVNTTAVTVTVPKTQISYVANSTMAALAENLSGSTSLDLFIRDGNTTWRVKP